MLKTTDNNCGRLKIENCHLSNMQKIANVKIRNLISTEHQNLLVFPNCLNQHRDNIGDETIFSLHGSTLTTGNIMGFIGINDSEIKITSRFTQGDDDYFLHYMLQKVFCINLFNLKHSCSQATIFDFLLYLFPYHLKKALRQGVFKEYQYKRYNNSNVRGSIDVNQHINKNYPFKGNVAYHTKEYSYDNRITQLIRHTIEYIYQHRFGYHILNNDYELQKCISQIVFATPSYDRNQRSSVLNNNIESIFHPYFYEYQDLHAICLRILHQEEIKYGNAKSKIYGLLFDGAWLWEEYLNTILKKYDFIHPENKTGKNTIYLFENGKYKRFPDFWKKDIVLDAKYKRLAENDGAKIDRNDMHQIISYMYVKCARLGGFIYPSDDNRTPCISFGRLNGYSGELRVWKISIPQTAANFNDFYNQMKSSENTFKNELFAVIDDLSISTNDI
jgi:5-methylcytosine-specific restriction endonuclease McrBC regulatory subunit McrC